MTDLQPGDSGMDAWIDEAVEALTGHGWFVGERALAESLVVGLAEDLDALVEENRLKRAGIGRERDWQLDGQTRRDWIHWLSRNRPAHAAFLDWAERLRVELNRRLFLALFEFEAHLALYPPGAFYRPHLDSFRGAANRIVSLAARLWRRTGPVSSGNRR